MGAADLPMRVGHSLPNAASLGSATINEHLMLFGSITAGITFPPRFPEHLVINA